MGSPCAENEPSFNAYLLCFLLEPQFSATAIAWQVISRFRHKQVKNARIIVYRREIRNLLIMVGENRIAEYELQ